MTSFFPVAIGIEIPEINYSQPKHLPKTENNRRTTALCYFGPDAAFSKVPEFYLGLHPSCQSSLCNAIAI